MAQKLAVEDQIIPLLHYPIKIEELYVMFSKKTIDKQVVSEFSQRLKLFKSTEKYKHIYKKYFPNLSP
ncbi:MAG: hypothetical protein GY928_23470 [Colwellia sp.]|nr:hypothetical protein [Colwellia sp.]